MSFDPEKVERFAGAEAISRHSHWFDSSADGEPQPMFIDSSDYDQLLAMYRDQRTVIDHICQPIWNQWGVRPTAKFAERVLAGEHDVPIGGQ